MRKTKGVIVIICVVLVIFSMCAEKKTEPTSLPTTTSEPTTPPTTTPPPTLPPTTTPAPIDYELELAQTLGLSEEGTYYMRGLDKDLEVNNNEGEWGQTFDELYKEKNIQDSTTEEILNIVYEGGMDYLEYFREKIIDSNVFNEMVKNEFELYEKDLFGRMVETEDPFIISQFDKYPEKKLPVYGGIFKKAKTPSSEAEEIFFTNLHKKMFDKYNGSHLGHFRNDGNWYLTNLVSIGEDGKVYFLYSGEMLKNDDQLDKWDKALDPLYNEYGSPETNMDNHFKAWAEGDNLKKENLVGKDLNLPFNLKKYEVDLRMYEDNEKKSRWRDVYSSHSAFGFIEIENTGRYELYELCVPHNPKNTIFSIPTGVAYEYEEVSDINSHIYIERNTNAAKYWSNLGFIEDDKYVIDMGQTAVPDKYKWKALLAILLGVQYTPEMDETGEKIRYTIID